MFANIGELLASSSLPKPLVAELPAACFGDKQPSAKWTAGWTAEPLAADERSLECFSDEQPSAKWTAGWTAELLAADERSAEWLVECVRDELPPERVVAEGRLGMRLSMPRARAVEEYSNSSKVKWGVNCIRKRI